MTLSNSNAGLAIALTCGAGFATILGFLIALIPRMSDPRYVAGTLAFAAGVMVMVSFIEIFPEATELYAEAGFTEKHAFMINVAVFFCGCIICLAMDLLAKVWASRRRQRGMKDVVVCDALTCDSVQENGSTTSSTSLLTTGLLTAIALTLHNFPEGIVTFLGTLEDTDVGISLAIAIGIHNIPEGVAVAMPILTSTGSKKRAFLWTLVASVAQPIGGLLAWLALGSVLGPASIATMMSITAGIMVYVGIVKLQTEATMGDASHLWSGYGFLIGMAVMSFSLVLFKIG